MSFIQKILKSEKISSLSIHNQIIILSIAAIFMTLLVGGLLAGPSARQAETFLADPISWAPTPVPLPITPNLLGPSCEANDKGIITVARVAGVSGRSELTVSIKSGTKYESVALWQEVSYKDHTTSGIIPGTPNYYNIDGVHTWKWVVLEPVSALKYSFIFYVNWTGGSGAEQGSGQSCGRWDSQLIGCTDSDGGKNYTVKGTTVGLAADENLTTRIDSCRTNNPYGDGYEYVVEWFCTTDATSGRQYAVNTNEKCVNGCTDGACRSFSNPTVKPTSLPTVAPTCKPKPACLSAVPPCKIAVPREGWCNPKATDVPLPTVLPSVSPLATPTPVPTSTSQLAVSTRSLHPAVVGIKYIAYLEGESSNTNDRLQLIGLYLPQGMQVEACQTKIVNKRTTIRCQLAGKTIRAGSYMISVQLRNNRGDSVSKDYRLLVLPRFLSPFANLLR